MALLFPADEDEFGMEIRDAPPAHMLIKFQSFSKLSRHGVEKHESRDFVTGNYKWRLIIYPNGRESKNEGDHISVYLSVAEIDSLPADWEINANLSIFLHNQISNNYLCFRGKARRFDAKNLKWGFSISKRVLTQPSNGYLVDDECAFGAEVFLSKTTQAINECLSLHDWKIFDYSKLKGVWNSRYFLAGGLRWKMKLYPNGNGTGAEGKTVSIYLECAESKSFAPHEKVKADFCIRIRNNLPHHSHYYKSTSHWFTSDKDDWGFAAFMSISDMVDPDKGFIVNDSCYLETQITVLDVVYTPKP